MNIHQYDNALALVIVEVCLKISFSIPIILMKKKGEVGSADRLVFLSIMKARPSHALEGRG